MNNDIKDILERRTFCIPEPADIKKFSIVIVEEETLSPKSFKQHFIVKHTYFKASEAMWQMWLALGLPSYHFYAGLH